MKLDKKNLQDIYELSHVQEGILFESLQESYEDTDFVQSIFEITGPLNVEKWKESWRRLIDRIRESIEKYGEHFLDRLFSKKEQEYCQKYKDPAPHFAARFAAKEAIAKALGTGFGESLSFHDLEIEKDELGKPHVALSDKLKKRLKKGALIHLSMSHCNSFALATAILHTA